MNKIDDHLTQALISYMLFNAECFYYILFVVFFFLLNSEITDSNNFLHVQYFIIDG